MGSLDWRSQYHVPNDIVGESRSSLSGRGPGRGVAVELPCLAGILGCFAGLGAGVLGWRGALVLGTLWFRVVTLRGEESRLPS